MDPSYQIHSLDLTSPPADHCGQSRNAKKVFTAKKTQTVFVTDFVAITFSTFMRNLLPPLSTSWDTSHNQGFRCAYNYMCAYNQVCCPTQQCVHHWIFVREEQPGGNIHFCLSVCLTICLSVCVRVCVCLPSKDVAHRGNVKFQHNPFFCSFSWKKQHTPPRTFIIPEMKP